MLEKKGPVSTPATEAASNVVDLAGTTLESSRLSKDADGNPVLQLTMPVKDGNDEVTSLTFRRPTAADLAAMDEAKGEVAKTIRSVSRATRMPVKVIEKLDGYDFLQAGAVVGDFLSRPR